VSGSFEISFEIADDEWERSAALRHDAEAEPLFDCFYGHVQVSANGTRLFLEPYYMSVADLAVGLGQILVDRHLGTRGRAAFHEGEDNLVIDIVRDGDLVRVISNFEPERRLAVLLVDFERGVEAFIGEFLGRAAAWVDDPIGWNDLQVLAAFAETS